MLVRGFFVEGNISMQTLTRPSYQVQDDTSVTSIRVDDSDHTSDDDLLLASNEPDQDQADSQSHPARRGKTPSILELIQTVQKLREAYRPLTQEEQELIRQWPGWGAYAPAFEPSPSEKWQAIGPQIRMLLGPEGYEAASAATPTSFFTPPFISEAIWRLAERLGFTGGAVLEPGCGTGQVLAHVPSSFDLSITGIEQEPFTAGIAQLLFPQAHMINAPLQEVALPDEAFDLVVGNVPFADVPIYDRTLPFKQKLSLHNYCIYRALAALRPGGLAILVTSRYTLDAKDSMARTLLSGPGMLLGAIRLPSSGHKWAKTAVITDILVLQRRYPQASWAGHEWVNLADLSRDGVKIVTSAYYTHHPEQILGTIALGRGMYRDNELVIHAPDNLEAAFDKAIQRIAEDASRHKSIYIPRLDPRQLDTQLAAMRGDGLKEGCFYLLNQAGLVEIVHGQPKAVTKLVEELSALVRLRDVALALLEAERDYSRTDEQLLPLRHELNRRYDAYVAKYGPLRRSTLTRRIDKETGEEKITRRLPTAMYAFRTDEYYPLVLGLEIYDDETREAKKAPIFSQRVNRPPIYKETADSPAEAIALSLDRYGRLDFTFIAQATGQPEEAIAGYLGDLAYEDPETQRWEIAPLYLSGNVRRKLDIARKALRSDPKWQRNVEALKKVQPAPIPPEKIKVFLGAPWIPVRHIEQFCQETFGLRPKIAREKVSSNWTVAPPSGVKYSARTTSTWGTHRASAFKLTEHLLNHKTTIIEDPTFDGKTRINIAETTLAQQKRKEIQRRFGEWIWEDLERTKELSTLYNHLYNGVVPPRFSGDHLSFPEMDAFWQEHLYPWQRDFIARMISARSALCAYPVGAGKTKIQVAGAMTLRRMKLISKAAILVPNHLLEQITAEAKQLYPGANILMISRDDLARENRRIFMARIATGDHDLVIMTHSAFEAINVHPETKRAYIAEQIRAYKQVLYSIDPHSSDKAEQRQIKRIEKQIQRMQERLKELLDIPRDAGITFEQLGVSYLIVDEAHLFKNLGLPTNQEKLAVTPSQRAQDMLMKLRWLEQHNGQRPFASFFTATPISNSMVEAFVMLYYLNYSLLKEYELFNVDDFASLFIETETKVEVTPNGAGFRLYERPSRFINFPELKHLFASVADIRSPDILADNQPKCFVHPVAVEPTPEVVAYVDTLVERSVKLQRGDPEIIEGKLDNMLWVTTDGRKAALWLGLHGREEQYPAKLDAIATEMAKVYHRWQDKASYLPGPYKSLQIGFCDMGTPNQKKGDQVYGELKRLLIQKGIPAQGIRFVHETGDSDAAKARLFEQCRTGEVAILLGSTAKLGTGTNIQTRCAAIHHCDAPWRPDEVKQREGRGQRPGNLYPVVEIFYYVQRRTFDAYSWQILSNKAQFFDQLYSSTEISREIAYSDDSALTFGQVKAAATGDILLLEHANVSLSAETFSQMHASFQRARDRDRQEASMLREEVRSLEEHLKRYQAIEQQAAKYAGEHPFMTPHRTMLVKKEERRAFIASEVLLAVNKRYNFHKIGYWQGVPLSLKIDEDSHVPYLLVVGEPYRGIEVECHAAWLEKDNQWRFGWKIEQFFEMLATAMEDYADWIKSKCQKAEEFEAQARVAFPQQEAWQNMQDRKQKLDRYIEYAAKARSHNDLKQLAEMRKRLLATVPKELTERPKPKNTASFVLPPRHPNAQEEAVSTARIEVAETEAREQTIEEVVHTIRQSLVGSRAAVSFGNLEDIQKVRKGRKGRNASTPSQTRAGQPKKQGNRSEVAQKQSQPPAQTKTEQAKTQRGRGTSANKQPRQCASASKRSAQKQMSTLWDGVAQDPSPGPASGDVEAPTPTPKPQQLALL
jgi:N12 class adenine-specific DNA methylase